MTDVVTRFAPSPTGFLHIGGARTALFNWLYAKRHNGKMLLRIEDTDRARSTEAAIDAIIDGLTWLGLDWEGEPVSQFSNAARHKQVAEELLANGNAYKCYATQEELEAMREAARAEGRNVAYDRRWRDKPASEAPENAPYVVRFKMPLEGQTTISDKVQGDVVFQNKDLEDLVILRSDGTPTYNLSVVVDDHDMGVTQIIRGDDHLINAAKQSLIYQAMGWPVPAMAHIPLIHGPDGAKMSKRHGALGVDAYRDMGFLPQAVRAYLARLGWSHGDQEFFTTEEMITLFDIVDVNKAPSRFDFKKLESFNSIVIKAMTDEELIAAYMAFLPSLEHGTERGNAIKAENMSEALQMAVGGAKARIKTLVELDSYFDFLFAPTPLSYTEEAQAQLTSEAKPILEAVLAAYERLEDWSHDSLEAVTKATVEELGIKFGKLGMPLRAALAGTMQAPGIYDILLIFGKEESLARIKNAINRL